jgi:hypothetical protein
MIKHILVVIVIKKHDQCIIRIENKVTARILSELRSILNDAVLYQFVSCQLVKLSI